LANILSLSDNTKLYVWLDFTKSSGANDGLLSVYVSTNGTKGSADASISTGTGTSDITHLQFIAEAGDIILDSVKISQSTIGDM